MIVDKEVSFMHLLGHWGELGRPFTSRLEQPHKQERHHTLTQNLKAMSLWVLLLITCLTFTLLSDVGHITHTCTQTLPLKCESITAFFTCLYHRCCTRVTYCLYFRRCFLDNWPAASVAPFVEPGLWYHCWVIEGSSMDRSHRG